MGALVPPMFPNFGWPSTGEYDSYYLAGDNLSNGTFVDFPVPKEIYGEVPVVAHNPNNFGGSVSSEGNDIDNNPIVNKKLYHNAKERDRRKKINSLFLSLRSCLPPSDQSKKLSIPATVSRSLQYIPELQEQVKKLMKTKEELLVQVSGHRIIEDDINPQPKAVLESYVSTVSTTRLADNEVMVQISSSKIHKFMISNVLSGLEEDGIVLVDILSSRSQGERLFYTLHLKWEKIENYKMNCEDLSQRILHLYEKCGNSFTW